MLGLLAEGISDARRIPFSSFWSPLRAAWGLCQADRRVEAGSELDNAEDNFAAGMAGLVEFLGTASFRQRQNRFDDRAHLARIDQLCDLGQLRGVGLNKYLRVP